MKGRADMTISPTAGAQTLRSTTDPYRPRTKQELNSQIDLTKARPATSIPGRQATAADIAKFRADETRADRELAARLNQGFEGALRAQGGQAAAESFSRGLQTYLEHMGALPPRVDMDV